MSRRRRAEKREVLPDAKYGDRVLTKFMNCLMLDGKKSAAENIVYGALDRIETRAKGDPVQVLLDALGIAKNDIAAIQKKSWGEILEASVSLQPPQGATGVSFGPFIDGDYLEDVAGTPF